MQASPTRHHPWMPAMLLLLILPLILALIYFRVSVNVFQEFGLSGPAVMALLFGSLVGSAINIPITRRKIQLADPAMARMSPAMRMFVAIFHYYPPAVVEEILAINVGGALVPLGFSAFLLVQPGAPILLALVTTAIVVIIAKLLARPVPGVGITLPGFVAPIVAAVVSFLLVKLLAGGSIANVATAAYVSGTLGTLIGADLLNLPVALRGGLLAVGPQRLWRMGPEVAPDPSKPRILSIGGAGVFDGVFLTGILASFLVRIPF
ncbi:MAG TPA: DUF1614 domain-containing protein [Ktedonobacterales bacterium]|nr:DUF1614 domain-containing protein [Ktedonobacterales bacterium]